MEKREGRRVHRWQKGQKVVLGQKEKRRLIQLGVCLLLFLMAFFIKGGERVERFRGELRELLQANADFGQAIIRLGQARRSQRPVGETLGTLWAQVFVPRESQAYTAGQGGPLFLQVKSQLTEDRNSLLGHKEEGGPGEEPGKETVPPTPSQPQAEETPTPQPEETAPPEWIPSDYDGQELPQEASMDWYDLHLKETVTPVMGTVSSPFGWRTDPNGSEQQFHHGLDMVTPLGTDVLAFAAGKVEYIGESDIYGQYLQIDHGNGVKSFYAHCSKLCVRQGKTVAAGEKIAESGDTGNATGPHLHLELKRDGMYLNPLYYVDVLP